MKFLTRKRNLLKSVLLIGLIAVMVVPFTACEEMGFPAATSPAETEEPEPASPHSMSITTADSAVLAVYQRLLDQAGSFDAKVYLADFYATCDEWTAEAEYFKDGSETWHVVVDMTESDTTGITSYWQQASWFVFRDGTVIPSNLFDANALRIEADLQALVPAVEPETE